MSRAHYTITANLDQDLEDWVRSQSMNRNRLVILALRSLRGLPPDVTYLSDFEADPYSAAMSRIAQSLVEARKHMGAMSQGEWQILRLIRNVIIEEDPAVLPEEEQIPLRLDAEGREVVY